MSEPASVIEMLTSGLSLVTTPDGWSTITSWFSVVLKRGFEVVKLTFGLVTASGLTGDTHQGPRTLTPVCTPVRPFKR